MLQELPFGRWSLLYSPRARLAAGFKNRKLVLMNKTHGRTAGGAFWIGHTRLQLGLYLIIRHPKILLMPAVRAVKGYISTHYDCCTLFNPSQSWSHGQLVGNDDGTLQIIQGFVAPAGHEHHPRPNANGVDSLNLRKINRQRSLLLQ